MRNQAVCLLLLIALSAAAAVPPAGLPPPEGRIAWEADLRIKRAERVFASPHEAGRVWVITAPGIMESNDSGSTWALLSGTARETLGRVEDVFFSPFNSSLILLASRDCGVFRSNDGGKSWQNIGTVATGLKNACVLRLSADPADRGAHIFYAIHGDAAAGISKTLDAGQSWSPVGEQYLAHDIQIEGRNLLIAGHPIQDEDAWGVIESVDAGDTWAEVLPNVRPVVLAANRVAHNWLWCGTLKGRIYSNHRTDRHHEADWQPVGPEDGEWASIFGILGAKPNEELLFAYDPHKYGLLCSRDAFKTWWAENSNLYVGRLVKEGAGVCANTTGRVFYASINGELYIGRLPSPDGPLLSDFKATPCVMQWTKNAPVTISVKVVPADNDPKSKIKNVHANLAHIHGPGNFQLFDDGKHDDGAANDGVYAATFPVVEDLTKQYHDGATRQHIPGQVMLAVTAVDMKSRATTELLPFSLYGKPESALWWDGDEVKRGAKMSDGRRASDWQHFDDRNGNIFDMNVEAHRGKDCLHIVAFHAGWVVGWGTEYEAYNMSDMDYLSFWIKTPRPTQRDLKVMLSDAPGGENDAAHSSAVWLIKDGYIKSFTTEYKQVRIPIHKFLKKSGFRIDMVGGVVWGGDDPNGHNFYVDDIGFEVEGQPLK